MPAMHKYRTRSFLSNAEQTDVTKVLDNNGISYEYRNTRSIEFDCDPEIAAEIVKRWPEFGVYEVGPDGCPLKPAPLTLVMTQKRYDCIVHVKGKPEPFYAAGNPEHAVTMFIEKNPNPAGYNPVVEYHYEAK